MRFQTSDMSRLLILITIVFMVACQFKQSSLFDEVNRLAEFEGVGEPTLIQYGEEDGYREPIMAYAIYKVDAHDFINMENSMMQNENFEAGSYYLNIELNEYLQKNHLKILNMSNSQITQNKYERIYYVYLLSDRQTFVICKVNL